MSLWLLGADNSANTKTILLNLHTLDEDQRRLTKGQKKLSYREFLTPQQEQTKGGKKRRRKKRKCSDRL